MSAGDGQGELGAVLLSTLQAHAPSGPVAWLARGLPQPGTPFARPLFFGFFAGAGRRLGQSRPELSDPERASLVDAGLAHPEAFSVSDLARAALLVRACQVAAPDEHVSLLREAFRKGDSGEQAAVMRCLSLLPRPEQYTELAAEASRTNVQDVFEALACDNPFPARFLPELNWNQLVMKALFTGVSLERIVDWQRRCNRELLRMACDYEAERSAAGRSVPSDIARIKAVADPGDRESAR